MQISKKERNKIYEFLANIKFLTGQEETIQTTTLMHSRDNSLPATGYLKYWK